jgi:hypothetical protein
MDIRSMLPLDEGELKTSFGLLMSVLSRELQQQNELMFQL